MLNELAVPRRNIQHSTFNIRHSTFTIPSVPDPLADLTVYQPNLSPVHLSLPPQTITLGRAADCTVPIRDRFLSRRHAEISYAGGSWIVRDCGSANGTLLNGQRLTGSAVLRPGDRILLGDSEVVFQEQAAAQAHSQLIPIDNSSPAMSYTLRLRDVIEESTPGGARERERTSA